MRQSATHAAKPPARRRAYKLLGLALILLTLALALPAAASAGDRSMATGLAIGEPYEGGVVAYILQSGDPGYVAGETRGLIAAAADQSAEIRWYNGSFTVTGATATALGAGRADTDLIIAVQGATATSYAAGVARAYSGGGYTDWYLPSKDELAKLYLNRAAIGGFVSTGDCDYWSSSEGAANWAWNQGFDNGDQIPWNKSDTSRVRAVRSFSRTPLGIGVTAPTGSASYAQGGSLTVSWTTSSAVSSGEFGVWARSPAGGWYIGQLVAAGGGTSFGATLTLDVPTGGGYEAIVAWRPTFGSGAWTVFGTSPGSFTVTGMSIAVTAPTGSASYTQGGSLTVSWTTSSAAATGEFGVWARSPAGGWYIGQLVAAGGGASFGATLTLDVPTGGGYEAIVAWRPTVGGGAWTVFGTSPGSFAVIGEAPLSITVTAPTGTSSYPAGADLPVSWTTSSAVSAGEFGVWARSPAGAWYIGKIVAASGLAAYSAPIGLDVPAGSGYQAIVAWRSMAGSGAWTVFGTSPGSFAVTGTALSITVTAPTGSSSYPAGANLTVIWTPSSAVSSGEFGVWARSPAGGWYIGKIVAAAGLAGYSTSLHLAVPAGGGYQAIVAWRSMAGSGAWTAFGTSPGSFAVTGTALAIGDPYQGGIIAYIDGTGLHGLIAATADQSTGTRWWNGTYVATGATATALGAGRANTDLILAVQGPTVTSYAAGLARASDGGGYTDWYLPSKDELSKLYLNRAAIGGFASTGFCYYWSSSEHGVTDAWSQDFATGDQGFYNKEGTHRVRAVRAF